MAKNKSIKVAIGMSGGVDSSVAAALLKKQGYDVIGIFMHFWSDPHYSEKQNIANKCCSLDAKEDARRVCDTLDISLYTMNFDQDFKKFIVDDFLKQYQQGLTPNPCVLCNQFIKFGLFWQKAKAMGADYISTGHYVQIKKKGQTFHLYEGKDKIKDQSYFLYRLNQDVLKHCIFPVGKYKKDKVRKLAKKFNLPVAQKRDSQEICFVPEKEHYEFLSRYLDLKPGNIISTEGKKIGEHKGLPLYTIGQRKGMELSAGPWYVVELNINNNQVIATNNPQHEKLFSDIMYIDQTNWLIPEPKLPLKAEVRIRYLHKNQKATITKEKKLFQIHFAQKQRAITPGQSAVIYKKGEVLGGGIIQK
jgi:tRNA-uridine 2-sulfurtransferase